MAQRHASTRVSKFVQRPNGHSRTSSACACSLALPRRRRASLYWKSPARLRPRHRALVQLVLDEPVAALKDDRFVIRDETNARTLGGGVVLNPFGRASRRPLAAYLQHLEAVAGPFGPDAIEAMLNLQESFALSAARIALLFNTPDAEVNAALRDPRFVGFGSGAETSFTTAARWDDLKGRVVQTVTAFHREQPLAPGLEMEALRSDLPQSISPREFRLMLERMSEEAALVREDSQLRLASHRVQVDRRAGRSARAHRAHPQ